MEKIKNYPSILTDRDVIEIFATIDLNFFKGKNPEQVTIREILQQTYRKMTGEEKRLLKAKKRDRKRTKTKNQPIINRRGRNIATNIRNIRRKTPAN